MAANPEEEEKRRKEETKKKIVLSILNLYAKKGGATLREINKDYMDQEGEKLAPTQAQGVSFMESMENVIFDKNKQLYRSCSILSQHIKKLVAEQNVKISPNYFGNRNNLNRSFPARPSISYRNDYADVRFPNTINAVRPAAKIQSRRRTLGPAFFKRSQSPEPAIKRPRSSTPEKDKPSTSKRNRSRSKSPRRRRDDRSPARHSPIGWPNRSRDISPRYSPPANYRSNRSPIRNRRSLRRSCSPARRRSRTPSRRHSRSPHRKGRSRTPPRRRSPSPKRPKRSQSPSDRSSRSLSPNKHSNSPNNGRQPSTRLLPLPRSEIQRNGQPSSSETNEAATHSNRNGQTESKAKKFKFTVVGDGCMYYMLYDMQPDVKSNLALCNHSLLISDALKLVHQQKEILQQKKRKVIISLGASDLRSNRKFSEMRRDITALFLMCDEYNLKPLITTIVCFDTIELKKKADLFNQFLFECFDNVVDMREVMKSGLSDVMTAMNKKHAMKLNKKTFELGSQQQLVLKIPKE